MNYKKTKQSDKNIKEQDDMQSVILDLARVTRVQRGGKRMRFRACVGAGDKKGKIGIGIAKGADVSIAVEKATRRAKKNMIQVPITEGGTIPHTVNVKFKAANILFKPVISGSGIKAGGVIRILCDLSGLKNISAKTMGTKNQITNAQAVIKAFGQFKI
ncbi:MAG: 30S ribosomal protein S5 [Patescibacteria group bacterium]